MNLKETMEYLEKGFVTSNELKDYYKVSSMLAIKEDRYDDATTYLNGVSNLNKSSDDVKPVSNVNRTISVDDIKAAIAKLGDKQYTIDDVINVIDPSLVNNQNLRNLVGTVIGNK